MANTSFQYLYNFPILDRLINDESKQLLKTLNPHQRELHIYESVRCNLENLVNTRLNSLLYLEEFQELRHSLFNYGIPDFTNNYLASNQNKVYFCQFLQQKIEKFEPRLKNLTLHMYEVEKSPIITLKLRIEALLLLNTSPERIIFDTAIETNNYSFYIKDIFFEQTLL